MCLSISKGVIEYDTMRATGKFLRHQKLSDPQITRLIWCYARWLTADEAVAERNRPYAPRATRPTAYKLYDLIRKRLVEIGYYKTEESFFTEKMEAREWGFYFDFQTYKNFVEHYLWERGSVPEDKLSFHVAEIIWRPYGERPATAGEFHHDILYAIKTTGRLNEPVVHHPDWYHYLRMHKKRYRLRKTMFELKTAEGRLSVLLLASARDLAAELKNLDKAYRQQRSDRMRTWNWSPRDHRPTEDMLNLIAPKGWALCGPSRQKARSRFRIPEYLEVLREHSGTD